MLAQTVEQQADIKILILGMGKTGYACANFFAARGIAFAAMDSRLQPPYLQAFQQKHAQVPVHTGGFDSSALQGIETLVVSPGIDLQIDIITSAKQHGLTVMGDIELFARHATAPVVAITGSNGKSTVTTLLGEMIAAAGLRVAVGGNLGTPALDLLDQPEPDFYVLELSSFQLDLVHMLPCVAAAVLNISADHMDRYPNLDAYVASKQRIYRHAQNCIINADDVSVMAMENVCRQPLYVSAGAPQPQSFGLIAQSGEVWLAYGEQLWLPASTLKLKGQHNYHNVLMAFALGHAIGISRQAMIKAAQAFTGLPHRCQWVVRYQGVDWFNDSKATNVGASIAAVSGMPGPVILIAGGDGKGADFSMLAHALRGKVKLAVLIGRDAPLIAHAFSGMIPFTHAADMRAAVREAAQAAMPGDTVLLAPACASLDMYSDYTARGEDFMRCVQAEVRSE